jgi:hypothetical protein
MLINFIFFGFWLDGSPVHCEVTGFFCNPIKFCYL